MNPLSLEQVESNRQLVAPAEASPSRWKRVGLVVAVTVVVCAGVAASVFTFSASTASSKTFQVPHTMTAQVVMSTEGGAYPQVSGVVHKTQGDDGRWVVTHTHNVFRASRITVMLALQWHHAAMQTAFLTMCAFVINALCVAVVRHSWVTRAQMSQTEKGVNAILTWQDNTVYHQTVDAATGDILTAACLDSTLLPSTTVMQAAVDSSVLLDSVDQVLA